MSCTLDGRKTWTTQVNRHCSAYRNTFPFKMCPEHLLCGGCPADSRRGGHRTVTALVELSVPRQAHEQATTPMNSHRVPALHLVVVPLAVHHVACSLPRGRTRAARETGGICAWPQSLQWWLSAVLHSGRPRESQGTAQRWDCTGWDALQPGSASWEAQSDHWSLGVGVCSTFYV